MLEGFQFVTDEHPQGPVASLLVVENLEIIEQGACQLEAGPPASAVKQLRLNAAPERFHHRVAVCRPDLSQRRSGPVRRLLRPRCRVATMPPLDVQKTTRYLVAMAASRGTEQTYGTILRELDDRVTATREEYLAAARNRYRVMRQAADGGMSQRAIGDLMDISKQRVQQILAAGAPSQGSTRNSQGSTREF